ncbi:MAG: type VII toxin-antitoxin system HepT family RNase toxin [Solirubrobacteraceae bacterium]
MVDRESVVARLELLARLLAELEPTRERGLDGYLVDDLLRAATERRLQLAEQVCIDIGAHLLSELGAPTASDYGGVFKSLADGGHLDRELAGRLIQAAKQRNLLVHAYLEIDNRKVFQSLEHLDDLRAFAAAVQRLLEDAGHPDAEE